MCIRPSLSFAIPFIYTPISITYFFERIRQKELISVRVRCDVDENSDESQGQGCFNNKGLMTKNI